MINGIKLSADSDYAAYYNYVDTYEEYGLALALEDLTITEPVVRTDYKTIRGMDGALDVSDAPQGYPVFENRTLSFKLFKAVRPFREVTVEQFLQLRTEFMARWQGQRVRITLPDDTSHYWVGRLSISAFEVGDWFVKCTAVVYPFKLKNELSGLEITTLTTSWQTFTLTNERRFVIPSIIIGQDTDIQMLQSITAVPPVVNLILPSGEITHEYKHPDTLLLSGTVAFQAKLVSATASPYLSITYREGTF